MYKPLTLVVSLNLPLNVIPPLKSDWMIGLLLQDQQECLYRNMLAKSQ